MTKLGSHVDFRIFYLHGGREVELVVSDYSATVPELSQADVGAPDALVTD